MKKLILKRTVWTVLYVLMLSVLTYKSFENGTNSGETSDRVASFLASSGIFGNLSIVEAECYSSIIRKLLGHFLAYAVLGFISYFCFNSYFYNSRICFVAILVQGLIWSALTEIFQIFATNRGPAFQDVIINFEGFLTSILIIISFIVCRCAFKNSAFKFNFNLFNYLIVFTLSIITLTCFIIFSEKTLQISICAYIFICTFSLSVLNTMFSIIIYSKIKKKNKQ